MSDLPILLEVHGAELTAEVLAEMYKNPFWQERYATRGEKHARQDGSFHLSYLSQALAANEPQIMTRYARWLQEVLCSRGMCTRHLSENFRLLAEAIDRRRWDEGGLAVALLTAARDALRYDHPIPGGLQGVSEAVARAAAAAMYADHPDWLTRWGEAGRARCEDDFLYHLNYLADAIALGSSGTFVQYALWTQGFLQKRGVLFEHFAGALTALRNALSQEPRVPSTATVPFLDDALAALEGGRT